VNQAVGQEQSGAELIRKAGAVIQRVGELRAEIDALREQVASGRGSMAQAAVMRFELTDALLNALARRASAEARLRDLVRTVYFTPGSRPRRRPAASAVWRLRKGLLRLGSPGGALVLLAGGVWRGEGRPLYDLRAAAAYVRRGADPAVQPASVFDQPFYLRTQPDVAQRGQPPLLHYVLAGEAEGRLPHPLFDPVFYAHAHGRELAATGLAPLAHFVRFGARMGLSPHPAFDMAYYAGQLPNLAPGEDLVSHYVREGWRLGLSPHPLFDPDWYQAQAGADASGVAPLAHYVAEGGPRGLSPHPLFDPAWYLDQHADVRAGGMEPFRHFLIYGAAEGRSPGPCFDASHYLAKRPHAAANPLADYVLGGAWEVSEPFPGFATAAYLAHHAHLARERTTPLAHWARELGRQV
jgi:hypothetical protein